ncbi:MAG: iron hydrogenase small subunit [Enterocloster bolteae]
MLRKSHENPDLMKLYSEYLGEPNGTFVPSSAAYPL